MTNELQNISNARQYERKYPNKSKQVFNSIHKNWEHLCKQAQAIHSNVTDIVSEQFNVPYQVAVEWVQSVSIMKAIGV